MELKFRDAEKALLEMNKEPPLYIPVRYSRLHEVDKEPKQPSKNTFRCTGRESQSLVRAP